MTDFEKKAIKRQVRFLKQLMQGVKKEHARHRLTWRTALAVVVVAAAVCMIRAKGVQSATEPAPVSICEFCGQIITDGNAGVCAEREE